MENNMSCRTGRTVSSSDRVSNPDAKPRGLAIRDSGRRTPAYGFDALKQGLAAVGANYVARSLPRNRTSAFWVMLDGTEVIRTISHAGVSARPTLVGPDRQASRFELAVRGLVRAAGDDRTYHVISCKRLENFSLESTLGVAWLSLHGV